MELAYIFLGISLLLLAFFPAAEIAFLANRLRAELKAEKANAADSSLAYFVKDPSAFFLSMLAGIVLALVIYGLAVYSLLHNFSAQGMSITGLIVLLVIGAALLLLCAEYLPRLLLKIMGDGACNLLLVARIFHYLFLPFVLLITVFNGLLSRVLGRHFRLLPPEYVQEGALGTDVEGTGTDTTSTTEMDKQIVRNAIEFPALRVRDCMIPRTEIKAVDVTDSMEEVKELFISSGHSKLLVYRENIDNIIGYIHLVDLYRNPRSIDKIVMPIIITTESMPASESMKQLIEKRRSVAVVLDEFGGTSGMITIEDLIEEIIGDIEDEHDIDESVEKKINDREYIFSARLEIDYLNETYGLNLPEGDYDTLGGLIFLVHQDIPRPKDIIPLPPFEFIILSTEQTRIKDVRLRILGNIPAS